jgi:hypothetical protein
MNMRDHEELEQRVQALSEKVEKLDRIVYRLGSGKTSRRW